MLGTVVLPPGTIACWRVDLEQPESVVGALAALLSADERERAARFVFPRDRRRFTVTRACLRALVARCCGEAATAIRFAYARHGKPALAAPTPAVHFNVSHAADVALIALTRDQPLGVDIEAVRPFADLRDVAARFFTRAENEAITTVPAADRELAFFLCWTRKEAFSKALGDGLTLALDRYRVSCRPGEPARILEIDGSPTAGAAWSVHDLRPAPGFVGAAVIRGARRTVDLRPLDLGTDILPILRT